MIKKIILQRIGIVALAICGAISFYDLVSPLPVNSSSTITMLQASNPLSDGLDKSDPQIGNKYLTRKNIITAIVVMIVVLGVLWRIYKKNKEMSAPYHQHNNIYGFVEDGSDGIIAVSLRNIESSNPTPKLGNENTERDIAVDSDSDEQSRGAISVLTSNSPEAYQEPHDSLKQMKGSLQNMSLITQPKSHESDDDDLSFDGIPESPNTTISSGLFGMTEEIDSMSTPFPQTVQLPKRDADAYVEKRGIGAHRAEPKSRGLVYINPSYLVGGGFTSK